MTSKILHCIIKCKQSDISGQFLLPPAPRPPPMEVKEERQSKLRTTPHHRVFSCSIGAAFCWFFWGVGGGVGVWNQQKERLIQEHSTVPLCDLPVFVYLHHHFYPQELYCWHLRISRTAKLWWFRVFGCRGYVRWRYLMFPEYNITLKVVINYDRELGTRVLWLTVKR